MSALDDLLSLLASPAYALQRLGSYKVDRMAREVIEAFKDVAVEQDGGGIRIVATTTVLRGEPTTSAPEHGTLVSVAEVTTDFGGSPLVVPGTLQWSNLDWSAFDLEAQDELEPALVIPDDRWVEGDLHGVGCWINPLELYVLFAGGGGGGAVGTNFPLPLNHSPTPELVQSFGGLQVGDKFLTGPTHANPYKVGTWNGSAWEFADPAENASYKFTPKRSLPGGSQRMFITAYVPSYSPKWQVRNYNPDTDEPYAYMLNGYAVEPTALSHTPQFGEVFLVKADGATAWSFKTGRFAWLDGDGVSWVFSGDTVGGLMGDGEIATIRDKEGNSIFQVMYRSSSGQWSQHGGGTSWEDSGLKHIRTAGIGVPTIVKTTFGTGVNYTVFTAPYACELIDAHVVSDQTRPGGTATLFKGAGGGQATGSMTCAVIGDIGRAPSIVGANASLTQGQNFYLSNSGATGTIWLTIVRTA